MNGVKHVKSIVIHITAKCYLKLTTTTITNETKHYHLNLNVTKLSFVTSTFVSIMFRNFLSLVCNGHINSKHTFHSIHLNSIVSSTIIYVHACKICTIYKEAETEKRQSTTRSMGGKKRERPK